MRSLTVKLTLAFCLISLVGVVLVAFFANQIAQQGVSNLTSQFEKEQIAATLGEAYAAQNRWPVGGHRSGNGGPRGYAVVDLRGVVVIPGIGFQMGQQLPPDLLARDGVPILADGAPVGTAVFVDEVRPPFRGPGGRQPENGALQQQIRQAILLAAVGATAVSALMGIFLARSITRPIKEMTTATEAIAQGDLSPQIPIRSEDELGQLATAFNQMSHDLARARDQRRQMTADIAHDLRTPLSLILGHAEALSDGVLPPTPETLNVIYDEAQRLNHLIDDLRTLSLADTGELSINARPVAPATLIERAHTAHQPAAQTKQIALETETAVSLPEVLADPQRIAQVLDNLLGNAIRHTPTNGRIGLAAALVGQQVQFSVSDSGPGIPAEAIPHLFNRFYRADKSRTRQEGGSGLGLAIARSIVGQHNGRIWVESQPGAGTTFYFTLPLA